MIQGFQMEALMASSDLTDAEWTIIALLLPGAEGRKNGRPRPTIARFSTAPALPDVTSRSAMDLT
ncbi:hypothetical protein UP09_31420 [Bradyrhizobium sp. LTSP885]|nr:hypothetical protein UP09_31420 [Bradyrhizobium sp. LTSP885]